MNDQLRLIQLHGRCREEGAHELFFSEQPSELAQAQRICARCQVKVACLRVALDERIDWGVWGGVIFWDGQPYYRRRSRGRPRRSEQHLPVEASWRELVELVRSA